MIVSGPDLLCNLTGGGHTVLAKFGRGLVISRGSRGCRVIIDGACPLDRLRPAAGDAEVFEMRDHLALCAGPVSGL
ncbi:hypothetical protein [Amycolatopsis sulphurea]|uniref:hypothetical protein n=1 Tax=Amycolatopsis sulphurea TaxID=76022 RepID=UPI0011454010|nr:hypothetical protein [Amycolatopsis sulphurea]